MSVSEFGILMVCTGNICRSPMAERMLLSSLESGFSTAFGAGRTADLMSQVSISSAGTAAQKGAPMTAEAITEAEAHGATGRLHSARRLTDKEVKSAGLILGMTREHRRAVVLLEPPAARRAFTLVEFARLLADPRTLDGVSFDDDDFAGALAAIVPVAAASRGYLPPPARPTDLDIADPYGQGARVYSQVAGVVGEATSILARSFVQSMRDT